MTELMQLRQQMDITYLDYDQRDCRHSRH